VPLVAYSLIGGLLLTLIADILLLVHLAGLATVPHGMLRLDGSTLAYVIRRIDRQKE
jgi:serine/threonine-protein kinase HipA